MNDACCEDGDSENERLIVALRTSRTQVEDCRKALTASYEAYCVLSEMFAKASDGVDSLRVGQVQARLALLVTGLGGSADWLPVDDD